MKDSLLELKIICQIDEISEPFSFYCCLIHSCQNFWREMCAPLSLFIYNIEFEFKFANRKKKKHRKKAETSL